MLIAHIKYIFKSQITFQSPSHWAWGSRRRSTTCLPSWIWQWFFMSSFAACSKVSRTHIGYAKRANKHALNNLTDSGLGQLEHWRQHHSGGIQTRRRSRRLCSLWFQWHRQRRCYLFLWLCRIRLRRHNRYCSWDGLLICNYTALLINQSRSLCYK